MECMICPKRDKCSESDCYYEHYQEKEPSREQAEDKYLLTLSERKQLGRLHEEYFNLMFR